MQTAINPSAATPHRISCACPESKTKRIASWVFQAIAAVILLQTLFFKFTGSEESVYIFSKLGVEPIGRYFAGTSELIAAILLLWPRMAVIGAGMAAGIMLGAIASHLGPLGIVVKDDGGLLFGLAVVVLVSSAIVLAIRLPQLKAAIKSPLKYVQGRV